MRILLPPLSILIALVLCLIASAPGAAPAPVDRRLVFTWQCYSQRIDYDGGGHTVADSTTTTERLVLREEGKWTFGSSTGTWSVHPIADGDWKRWSTKAYGPTQKIILDNWGGKTVDGPIEADKKQPDRVNFVWLIYHVDKPRAGTISIKYGHVNKDIK